MMAQSNELIDSLVLNGICGGESAKKIAGKFFAVIGIGVAILDFDVAESLRFLDEDWEPMLSQIDFLSGLSVKDYQEIRRISYSACKVGYTQTSKMIGDGENIYTASSFFSDENDFVVLTKYREDQKEAAAYAQDAIMRTLSMQHRQNIEQRYSSTQKDYLARMLLLSEGAVLPEIMGVFRELRDSSCDARDKGFAVAVFEQISAAENVHSLPKLKTTLAQTFPETIVCLYQNQILALLCGIGIRATASSELLLTKLNEFCISNGMHCGLSAAFSDIDKLNVYRKQALSALKCTENNTNFRRVNYIETVFEELILRTAISAEGSDALLIKPVRQLADYDAKNNTQYMDTLEQYLSAYNRIADVSKNIFVDRSTVKYRLQIIKKLININVEDPTEAKRLRRGIIVYRIMQTSNRGKENEI